MMKILESIRVKASALGKHIVLPEGEDVRTLQAAQMCVAGRIAKVTLLGNADKISEVARSAGIDTSAFVIVDPRRAPDFEKFAQAFHEMRRAKGLTIDEAREHMKEPLYYGNMMVRLGLADGSVAGATHSTAKTVRSALQVIGLSPKYKIVSRDRKSVV